MICEVDNHSYVRTIRILKNGNTSIDWHLNEDQKENENYLSDDELERLYQLNN